jgi:hypothetical protein
MKRLQQLAQPLGAVAALCCLGINAPLRAQAVGTLSPEVRRYVLTDARVVALTWLTVIDGTGRPAAENQTVLIEDGLITATGPAARIAIPEGARVFSLAGHTAIPGLVGMHDHFGGAPTEAGLSVPQQARLYLAGGVTSIRTAGTSQPYRELNLKHQIDTGQLPGPRIFPTGPYLTTDARNLSRAQLTSPEKARRLVAYWADEGVTWFKVYGPIRLPELRAVIDAAHLRGRKVTGHLCSDQWPDAVRLGIDNLEHGPPGACREATFQLDSPQVGVLIRDLVEAGVAVTSTLAYLEAVTRVRPLADARFLELMNDEARQRYHAWREPGATAADSNLVSVLRNEMAFERAFATAGGLLVAGSDPMAEGVFPGLADQRNYELLMEAGFTPPQGVRIMTANGATLLGEFDRTGSIEAGKRADVVIIRGNPQRIPADIRNVVLVFKDGVVYDAPALWESVRAEVQRPPND